MRGLLRGGRGAGRRGGGARRRQRGVAGGAVGTGVRPDVGAVADHGGLAVVPDQRDPAAVGAVQPDPYGVIAGEQPGQPGGVGPLGGRQGRQAQIGAGLHGAAERTGGGGLHIDEQLLGRARRQVRGGLRTGDDQAAAHQGDADRGGAPAPHLASHAPSLGACP
ncbi:hypothetical protein SDC9_115180 [bioreactor metagenome]|uniref:Uncharacterized protein n=1 Tax=bioreactor metagenome TaxID=1076179 RepID=A0A645BS49_9ZZZZ